MIAKIAPLIKLPSTTDVFDYFVPDEMAEKIKLGHLVTIPWRLKKITGVVLNLEKSPSDSHHSSPTAFPRQGGGVFVKKFRARPITNILDENPVLTKAQLKLIKKFSKYYFVSSGSAARLITPDKPKRIIKPKPKPLNPSASQLEFKISKTQLAKLQEAASNLADKTHHIQINDISSFVWLILRLAKGSGAQTLVLFPAIDLIESLAPTVHKKYSDDLAIIHSNLSLGKYWSEYQKILSGRAKIIFSTRQGVFLPMQEKSRIIFFESTSQDFKQYDQHPKYDARIVAEWLSRSAEASVFYCSASPNMFYRHPEQNDDLFLPSATITSLAVKLVDMKQEMHKRDFSIISDSALDEINEAVSAGKKVLIMSLRQDSDEGVSVSKIKEALTNSLKNCKLSIYSDKTSLNDFDVLITTAYPIETLKLNSKARNFEMAVFSSIEPLLALPDFRASERTLNRLYYWKMMCQELGIKKIILQSYSPENLAIRAFAYGELDSYKKSELENRKQLLYPPFSQLIKISYKAPKGAPSKFLSAPDGPSYWDANTVKEKLAESLGTNVRILGPFKDKKEQESLLLKITTDVDLSAIRSLPFGWRIDRDPENVL